ncbi:hypothetical protein DICA1_C04852 [Diutina catenulata]
MNEGARTHPHQGAGSHYSVSSSVYSVGDDEFNFDEQPLARDPVMMDNIEEEEEVVEEEAPKVDAYATTMARAAANGDLPPADPHPQDTIPPTAPQTLAHAQYQAQPGQAMLNSVQSGHPTQNQAQPGHPTQNQAQPGQPTQNQAQLTQNSAQPGQSTQNMAPSELNSKFQRLSMTLQQSKTNNRSQAFMSNFQSNVDKAAAEYDGERDKRASYYSRIHRPPSDEASSVSSAESAPQPASQPQPPSPTTPSPEVPVRQDLVAKYEQLQTTDAQVSARDANDLYIGGAAGSALTPQAARPDDDLSDSGSSFGDDDDDLSTLFVRSLHPFDAQSLQSDSDASICLSFDKDDLAFVHTIDESGWGEVTLVESLSRGWVPMNYFAMAVVPAQDEDDDEEDGLIPNSHYLRPLFDACGKFLINPLSHRTKRGRYTFSIRVVNAIRDGVRLLLQYTDCLSRANEIVTKRPVVRKSRKSLLADWYGLMVKASEYKGTSSFAKIEILTLMVYQVTMKATIFLQVWSMESRQIVKRDNERKLQSDMNNYPLLAVPPSAKSRITEINGLLYSYLGLIIGRLDLVEHNPVGCDMLETLTHQIILLLRELLFISKTGSDFSAEKPADLDASLDTLLSLVSDLVSGVKNLVVKTLNEQADPSAFGIYTEYYYTPEGGDLIQVASRIVRSISKTIASIRKLLEVTGDFKLNSERSYPDYSKIRIDPDDFIRKCTVGIARSNPEVRNRAPVAPMHHNRYSLIRAGKTGELGITPGGANILHDVLAAEDGAEVASRPEAPLVPDDELMLDAHGSVIGASFRGLVYTLTNEQTPPDYFFVSTFFLCFRSFASAVDLTEELISRFDASARGSSPLVKNRRRLVVKMFQLWMESYWNPESDFSILTTLINFFNEGVSPALPLDAMRLMETAVRLSTRPLVENAKPVMRPQKQLVARTITAGRASGGSAGQTSASALLDGYDLARISSHSSGGSSSPPPTKRSSLLSRAQMAHIEKLNLTYRTILGTAWTSVPGPNYVPLDTSAMLASWFVICGQSWVLSSYKPTLFEFNGLEIAKQLTLIESSIFCAIKPDELLNQNFSTKRLHLSLAPNVQLSLQFTNCLSGYVLESVLQPELPMLKRVNAVKTWLKVAISCLYLRNFNSLAAIITSLQSHMLTRVAPVFAELTQKYRDLYDYLAGIIHPDKNYHVYRTKLRNFLVANDFRVPIVPYFSLFLQDLTFVTDGNPSSRTHPATKHKVVNIDKYLKITRTIADIESLQTSYVAPASPSSPRDDDYYIHPCPALQELILLELWKVQQLNSHEKDRAWNLSLAILPRELATANPSSTNVAAA